MRKIRYLILLLILLFVAGNEYHTRNKLASWDNVFNVVIFPINGDGSNISQHYIDSLELANFAPIAGFINTQSQHYAVSARDVIKVQLGETLGSRPPKLPRERSILKNVYWSMCFRFWAAQQKWNSKIENIDIALFVLYFDPKQHKKLEHSIGLQKGLIGMVNAFAHRSYQGSNNIIMAHELLHTFGATDKYDLQSNLPLYPIGYAEPMKQPRYPQRKAEIMGGRIPKSPYKAEIPRYFRQVIIGEITAREIHWIKD